MEKQVQSLPPHSLSQFVVHKLLDLFRALIYNTKKQLQEINSNRSLWFVFTPSTKPLLYAGRLIEATRFFTGDRKGFGVTGCVVCSPVRQRTCLAFAHAISD